jgi:hypothetical protein
MLSIVEADAPSAYVAVLPARTAVVSWNTNAPADTIEVVVHGIDGQRSAPLAYATFAPGRRSSLDGSDGFARIATDVIAATSDIVAVEVRAHHPLARVGVTTPAHAMPAGAPAFRGTLAVPPLSQYVPGEPGQRGWCAPAAVAMLLGAWGVERSVADVAAAVHDTAYGGTGNWAFCMAYAGALGFAATAAYVRDLGAIEALLDAGIPVAASIAWEAGALPGAPLDASRGHLVVIRGFTREGDPLVNDPAAADIATSYPRAAFERCWLGHGGMVLAIAPAARLDRLAAAANA